MEPLNRQLFLLLNAGPHLGGWPLWLARGLASDLIVLVPIGLTVGWLWGPPRYREALVDAALTGLAALGINQLIALFYTHPRPFVLGLGHAYLTHAADSSFPSDHVTLLATVGLSLLVNSDLLLIGGGTLLAAVAVGWARVFLGVHFPFDIVGGIEVAAFTVVLVTPALPPLLARGFEPMLRLYRRLFARLIAGGWVRN